MTHFGRDLMRIGPAPTMAREIPVTIFFLLFSILGLLVVYTLVGGMNTALIVVAVVLGGYTLARPVIRAIRGDQPTQGA